MSYAISIGGDTRPLDKYSVTEATLTLRANDFDTLEFSTDTNLNLDAYPYGTEVKAFRDGVCVFVGEITSLPGSVVADGVPEVMYTATGYLSRLEKIQYCQETTAIDANGKEGTFIEPSVTLGRKMTNAAQIKAILDFASSRAPVSAFATWPGGYNIPPDTKSNISCWDAIFTMLRWLPDHVLWCDYASGATVARLTPKASMAKVAAGLVDAEKSQFSATPRHDLQMVGLNVYFRLIGSVDGATTEKRIVQSAGNHASAYAEKIYVDLQGASMSRVSQSIEVAKLPDFSAPHLFDVRAFFQSRTSLPPSFTNWNITEVTRNGANNYPNELKKGVVTSWMPIGAERETLMFKVKYEIRDKDKFIIETATLDAPVSVVTTDGATKTYRAVGAFDSGEAVPEGMAAGIFSAWSSLHWDGRMAGASLPKPGQIINVSGSAPEFATMDAIVQELAIDLATDIHSARFGTSRAIEADSYMALMRSLRNHRLSYRLSDEPGDGGDDGGADAAEGITETSAQAYSSSPGVERTAIGARDGDKSTLMESGEITIKASSKSATIEADRLRPGDHAFIREVKFVADIAPDGTPERQTFLVLSTEPEGEDHEPLPHCGHPGNGPDSAHPYNPTGGHPGNSPTPPCAGDGHPGNNPQSPT